MALRFNPIPFDPGPSGSDYATQWGKGLNDLSETYVNNQKQRRQDQLSELLFGIKASEAGYDPNSLIGRHRDFMGGSRKGGPSPSPIFQRTPEYLAQQQRKTESEAADIRLKNSQADWYDKRPTETNYVVPTYGTNGEVTGWTPAPPGSKPFGGGRPPSPGKGVVAGSPAAQSAFNLYETARDTLKDALGKTNTGYFAGKIPAITADQQNASNAVAQMAPVLKQLFRVSGEGTFTDKDQELLLNMVAGRGTDEAAVPAQIEAMDRLIKAKLGIIQDDRPAPTSSPEQGGKIRVRHRATGKTGSISPQFFDPNKYERL